MQCQLILCNIVFAIAFVFHPVGEAVVQLDQSIAHFVRKPVVEVIQHFFQHAAGIVVNIELIGIWEKEALQAVTAAALYTFQEPVIVQFAGGRIKFLPVKFPGK